MMYDLVELNSIDAAILVEVFDNPFKIGAPYEPPLTDEQKANDVSEYKEYHLEHGKEGKLITFKRGHATEVHHAQWDENEKEQSGKMMSNRTGANPRYISTMAHVVKSLIERGRAVRIAGTVSNGMFDKYRRLGVILAKRHGLSISHIQPYSTHHPEAADMKEFTIHKTVGESMVFWMKAAMLKEATFENNYYIPEMVIGEADFLTTK